MTAVEWLVGQMLKQGYFDVDKPLTFTNLDHLQQQAKEMEKQQGYSEEEVEAIWKFALYSAEQHDKFGTKNKSNFITKDVKEFIEQFKNK